MTSDGVMDVAGWKGQGPGEGDRDIHGTGQ